jgi:hypothetical protein
LTGIIEWDDGYPTTKSLHQLRKVLDKDYKQAVATFYAALRENYYPDYCGPERVEVRNKVIDVWAYHTGGWGGNESIITVLKESWLFDWLLERYDSGGHYYFRPMERVLTVNQDTRSKENAKEVTL